MADGTLPVRMEDEKESDQPNTAAVGHTGGKIIEKLLLAKGEKRPFYSFEFFPPKTRAGVTNLFSRIERMASLEPGFIDVTWGAGGSTAKLTLDICSESQNHTDVMMHITCTSITKDNIRKALVAARDNGIRNILALRGDPSRGAEQWEPCEGGFAHASELVRFIRSEFGDYFGIAVAGYPEGHISATSLQDDIKFLKEKVDAGADFIMTQMFYDVSLFLQWRTQCRAAGIVCPIIPGIMPIQNYTGFMRMTSFCRTNVPPGILESLHPIRDDDSRVKQYGIDLAINMCKELLNNQVEGLHFYTLNLERSVTQILEGLLFVASPTNNLPWKQSLVARRRDEDVRPIFWANRPDSYLDRTAIWDEFPNGRWGNASSPAFGELNDYHLSYRDGGSHLDRRKLWGEVPTTHAEIYQVFTEYIDNKCPRLPWCESPIQLETIPIKLSLLKMNTAGFLTINSQPKVNGAPSTDPAVGWGGAGGFVYQKAYLEFFTTEENVKQLETLSKLHPAIQFSAINVKGELITNNPEDAVTAVTWGVFPGKEIQQPTVVDHQTFAIWKEEAFALWKSQWQILYKEDTPSWKLLEEVHDTYFLVNVVDNDYIHGEIFTFFEQLPALQEVKLAK